MNAIVQPNAEPLLLVSGLSVSYTARRERFEAVKSVSFTAGQGEVVALVGESGSGKTTIARSIMAMLPAAAEITGGSVRYEGRELVGLSEKAFDRIRGRRIGWIPQDPMVSLNPLHKVGKQVAEPLRIHGLAASAVHAEERAVALLQRVGIANPEVRIHQYPHELSGGMRQRVLIAGALAAEPRLIIADEPTTALDVTVQKRILDDIQALAASSGISVLLITHDLAVAADRADRIIVLRSGEIVEEGPARQVLSAPAHSYTRLLLASAPSLAGGRRRHHAAAPRAVRSEDLDTPKQLVVEAVSKSFTTVGSGGPIHTVKAVDSVSLDLSPGETLGLVGESGSGKSTLARIILGLTAPSAGRVLFEGRDIAGFDREARRHHRQVVQPVYQNPYASLNPRLSIEEIIAEPLLGFGLGDRRQRRQRVAELLDQVKLPQAVAVRRSSELSGGQRQRVAIARALAPRPALIICDEPVSALDVSVQAQILDLLSELQERHGLSYLFISHDLAVVRQVADRVAVMKDGRLVETGSSDAVFGAPRDDYTRLLLASIPGTRREAA